MSSLLQIGCEVEGCNKPSDPPKEYFPFPKTKLVCDKWIKFCKKKISNKDVAQSYICSLHFEETAYINEIQERDGNAILIRRLNVTAVPTLLPPNSNSIAQPKLDTKKYGHIKTSADLLKLKVTNKILERKLKNIERNASEIRNYIAQQKANVKSINSQTNTSGMMAKKILSKVFTPAQIKLLCTNKKTYWSKDDLAIACTIRYLSNRKFYEYLTTHLHFPLPADSSIRRIVSGRRDKDKVETSSKEES